MAEQSWFSSLLQNVSQSVTKTVTNILYVAEDRPTAISVLNSTLTGIGVVGVVALAALIYSGQIAQSSSQLGNLAMIAAGAFALGSLIGFILGATTEEKQTFSPMTGVLNGIIGGFTLADLGKKDSVIKAVFHSLAAACGLQGSGLVASVIAFFGSFGFICMYINKQYVINPAAGKIARMDQQSEKLRILTRNISISDLEMDQEIELDEDQLKKVKDALAVFKTFKSDSDLIESLSVDTLRSYAKGFLAAREYTEAEWVLRKARKVAPEDQDVMFYLASVLTMNEERTLEAIPLLSYLYAQSSVRLPVFKSLGYALLFDPSRLDESEKITQKYRSIRPNDAGALLNLACVFGQRGAADPENPKKLQELLLECMRLRPKFAFRIDDLRKPGDDFFGWDDVTEFKPVLEKITAIKAAFEAEKKKSAQVKQE